MLTAGVERLGATRSRAPFTGKAGSEDVVSNPDQHQLPRPVPVSLQQAAAVPPGAQEREVILLRGDNISPPTGKASCIAVHRERVCDRISMPVCLHDRRGYVSISMIAQQEPRVRR